MGFRVLAVVLAAGVAAVSVTHNALGLGARPEVRAYVELGGWWWAGVSGTSDDATGMGELLAVAGTVRLGPAYDPPPRSSGDDAPPTP